MDIIKKPKLLLHICCASCGAYVSRLLDLNYEVFLFFQNSNIFPESEFHKRREEVEMIAKKYGLYYEIDPYDHGKWLNEISGHERDEERGQRCFLCYELRMRDAVNKAKELGADYFCTTLSVSPYKVFTYIKQIGDKLAAEHGIKFIDEDFKKLDGAKKASELAKELDLYRQKYCGCEFSMRSRNE